MAKSKDDTVDDEPTIAQALASLAEIARQGQEVQKAQLKQTAKKSNEFGPNISPYNPRGEKDFPMPLLKCPVDCPSHETPTYNALDREEIELLNLLEPGDYLIEMLDGSTIPLCVLGTKNHETGKLESMRFAGQYDEDARQHGSLYTHERRSSFPSLKSMVRQMLEQRSVAHAGVLTMVRERALIKSGDLSVSVGE